MLKIPPNLIAIFTLINNNDDRKFIKSIGSNVMKLQFDAEKMPINDRDNHIIKKLPEMEKSGTI